MKALFTHHASLQNAGILYDGASERRVNYTLEGGDVHALRRDLVVLGFSERSSPAAIDQIATSLFETAEVRDVIVVVMPREMTAIHRSRIAPRPVSACGPGMNGARGSTLWWSAQRPGRRCREDGSRDGSARRADAARRTGRSAARSGSGCRPPKGHGRR